MKRNVLLITVLVSLVVVYAGHSDSKKEFVTQESKAPAYVNEAGAIQEQMLITKDVTGDPGFYMGRAVFQPGATIPEHIHKEELEAIYMVKGNGKMTIGTNSYELRPGFSVYVPPNTPHSFTNNGKEEVEVIHMYAPGGPEDRFKSWKRRF